MTMEKSKQNKAVTHLRRAVAKFENCRRSLADIAVLLTAEKEAKDPAILETIKVIDVIIKEMSTAVDTIRRRLEEHQ